MSVYVGLDEGIVIDSDQGLQFPLLVMYPTFTPAQETKFGAFTLDVAVKAAVKEGTYPLVVISHGSGGSHLLYRTLAAFLAKNGFFVVLPEHPFNNRNNNDRNGTLENLIDRPRHIRQAIDTVIADARWSRFLQPDHIALIGHSMGGYTALALAGGVPHTKHQIEHDPQCTITTSQEIPVAADPRVKALVLFAPAAGWFLSEAALEAVKVPVLLFSAEMDTLTPLIHAEIIKRGVGEKALVTHKIVKNAGHYSFLSPFPAAMRRAIFPPSMDPEGFDRETFHSELNVDVLAFLTKWMLQKSPGM